MDSSSITFLIYIISFIISILVLVYFFRLANDIREIKANSNRQSDGNSLAGLLLIEGKKEDAILLIVKTYKLDVIQILERYRDDGVVYDKKVSQLSYQYVRRYLNSMPELTNKYFIEIQKSVEKIYFKS